MHNKIPVIIAIDGTAGSGKGTLAKRLAQQFGYDHLDTGKLYRATAFAVMQNGGNCACEKDALQAVKGLQVADFSNVALTRNDVGNGASRVSKISAVREALIDYQRTFPNGKKGVVVDGRDIGTVIFPNASIKFFIDADVVVRAKRRYLELQSTGIEFDTILTDLKARDTADKTRRVCPLVPAIDAHHIDTTNVSIDSMLEHALDKIRAL